METKSSIVFVACFFRFEASISNDLLPYQWFLPFPIKSFGITPNIERSCGKSWQRLPEENSHTAYPATALNHSIGAQYWLTRFKLPSICFIFISQETCYWTFQPRLLNWSCSHSEPNTQRTEFHLSCFLLWRMFWDPYS